MDVTRQTKRNLRLQRYLFTLLLLAAVGLLGWLSTQYRIQTDWTYGARNSLSADSERLLAELEGPLTITAFVRDQGPLRDQVRELVGRYERVKPDIQVEFVNPDRAPERVRELGVSMEGELRIAYQGRSERVQEHTEQALSNAILRVARQGERWIGFLTGHGERDPHGQANHDLGHFGAELERKGLKVQSLNLAETRAVPDNLSVLVIASPQLDLLPGEVRLVREYLEAGGNLLWLADPGETGGMASVAEYLGVEFLPGVIVDASTQLFGIESPDVVLVTAYTPHPVTRELRAMTLFPHAQALQLNTTGDWDVEPLLSSMENTWTELGTLEGRIGFDAGSDERAGPLDLAHAFTRSLDAGSEAGEGRTTGQRVAVIGDGDFLSNSFLGNVANLDLGLNLIDWLSHDDSFIAIRPRAAPDQSLELGRTAQAVIGFGFLFVLPALLVLAGLIVWLRRRKR
ncbi:ABC-type uncharacterized transporte, auxiliary component [Thiohalobacter thiocyanaticus]|uniref:ABC-type uncharacterized transporte, auxiliary component n=1 Tax=Thiohalobacter thiocyanaticus TaxID=585455 RepID=A0A1Z4VUU5_9GAMM|nr:GldG family protein [Thiohalobacter thiocyanaticus]BAZ95401.1 ABC-type uncharacterized transporte, auxiliary component [Thiohalobacter thiocyanaticus]